jgi:alpha-glucosidase
LCGPGAGRIRFAKPFGIARVAADATAATMRAFNAVVPWRSLTASLNLLDSHDTARFRTIAGSPERTLAGVGLLMAWPGVPMIFAGDEVGVEGRDADDGRRPMPWDTRRWDHRLLDAYRRLITVRRASHALRHGGLRWVHVGRDVMVFLRETHQERVLVHISRADHEVVHLDREPLAASGGSTLYGAADLQAGGTSTFALPNHGPAVHLWRLEP